MSIKGKIALITGAGQGIGRAIALRLAKDGADIAVVDVQQDKMDAVVEEIKTMGCKATTFKADVTKRDDIYAAVDHAETELGGFDIIVNNAGISQTQPLVSVTPDEFDRILKVNVGGVLWGIQPRRNSRCASRKARLSTLPRSPATTDSPCSASTPRPNLRSAP